MKWVPASVAWVLIQAAGCHGGGYIAAPGNLPADSGLVIFVNERSGLSAFVGSTRTRVLVDFTYSRAEAERIELLVTALPESLGLEEGRLELNASGCSVEEALRPSSAWLLDGDTWTATDSGSLRDVRLQTSNCPPLVDPRCLPYHVQSVPLVASGRPLFAVPVGDSLLLGTFGPELFVLGPDFNLRPVSLPAGLNAVRSAWVDAHGQLWIGSSDQTLARAILQDSGPSLSVTTVASPGSTIAWMAQASTSTSPDILTLSSNGSLDRLQGRVWSELSALNPIVGIEALGGGLAELSPGDVLVGYSGDSRVLRFRDGVLNNVAPAGLATAPTILSNLGAAGTFALHGPRGDLLVWGGARFTEVPEASLGVIGRALASWRGFLFVAGDSSVRQYVPGLGLCPNRWVSGNTMRALIPFQGKLVGIAGHGSDNELLFIDAD